MSRPGRPGGKRDENRKARTRALTEAALRLGLAQGLRAVTVDDVTREAGTAKGNFYRYFPDKTALVEALVAPVRERLAKAFSRCDEELSMLPSGEAVSPAYEHLALDIAHTVAAYPDIVRLVLTERRGSDDGPTSPIRDLADEVIVASVGLSKLATDRGLLRQEDPQVSALAVVGAVEELTLAVLRGALDAPPEAVARTLVSLVLDGIRARD
jgi:AcrR family transcriptional regulator